MTSPQYARLAARLLGEHRGKAASPPPAHPDRARAIASLEEAIARRARTRRWARWGWGTAAAAASVIAIVGASRLATHRGVAGGTTSSTGPAIARAVQITGHPVSGSVSVVSEGTTTALDEGRVLASGTRLIVSERARALLAFSTGTNALLDEGADLRLESLGPSEDLALDAGAVDLHVAKIHPDERFRVHTPDSEVEVRGTQFRVWIAAPDASCGGGTTTRVSVSEGVVVVRHAGAETRVSAGEQWPSGCGRAAETVPAGSVAGHTPSAEPPSNLGAQNDLFAAAVAAKRQGNLRAAVTAFDRFLGRYPGSPLAESAHVEKMRILRATDPSRAVTTARDYLARFPAGFGRAEAEAIVAGAQ
jgi:hypothetical protein